MTRQKLIVALAGAAGALLLATNAPAQTAQDKALVDAAKGRGEVGEQADGFIGVRTSTSAEVRAAIAAMNAGRAQVYREAAKKNGVTPEAAGPAAFKAEILPNRIRAGEYYRDADGSWKRR